jgi:hypothetical protein
VKAEQYASLSGFGIAPWACTGKNVSLLAILKEKLGGFVHLEN